MNNIDTVDYYPPYEEEDKIWFKDNYKNEINQFNEYLIKIRKDSNPIGNILKNIFIISNQGDISILGLIRSIASENFSELAYLIFLPENPCSIDFRIQILDNGDPKYKSVLNEFKDFLIEFEAYLNKNN